MRIEIYLLEWIPDGVLRLGAAQRVQSAALLAPAVTRPGTPPPIWPPSRCSEMQLLLAAVLVFAIPAAAQKPCRLATPQPCVGSRNSRTFCPGNLSQCALPAHPPCPPCPPPAQPPSPVRGHGERGADPYLALAVAVVVLAALLAVPASATCRGRPVAGPAAEQAEPEADPAAATRRRAATARSLDLRLPRKPGRYPFSVSELGQLRLSYTSMVMLQPTDDAGQGNSTKLLLPPTVLADQHMSAGWAGRAAACGFAHGLCRAMAMAATAEQPRPKRRAERLQDGAAPELSVRVVSTPCPGARQPPPPLQQQHYDAVGAWVCCCSSGLHNMDYYPT